LLEHAKKFLPQNFNDFLCLLLVILITASWLLAGVDKLNLPPEISGAEIVTWTLLVQYYFRKKAGGS
jgi:uncharacterized membrane protein YuzA (DUF378 family)